MRNADSAFRAAWLSSIIVLSACALPATVGSPAAPSAANAGDWPSYNRTLAGDRFSPLAEITTTNAALDARDGHVVWKFDVVPAIGPARATWLNPRLPIGEIGPLAYDLPRS